MQKVVVVLDYIILFLHKFCGKKKKGVTAVTVTSWFVSFEQHQSLNIIIKFKS